MNITIPVHVIQDIAIQGQAIQDPIILNPGIHVPIIHVLTTLAHSAPAGMETL
ncbi:MAG: hypothetical protein ACTJG4_07585 [Vreelandella alkaliphila]|uniref:hypothetical protein n=1 Tax=Halomonadaceae TaxID=28256 RepID=UPI001868E71D|nr:MULTISPECIES: hypothetical protein [unclassified Halomonas]